MLKSNTARTRRLPIRRRKRRQAITLDTTYRRQTQRRPELVNTLNMGPSALRGVEKTNMVRTAPWRSNGRL
ncbi:MAG TPA: hypothetical protein VGD49_00265 [Longimicrobiales bacterium]